MKQEERSRKQITFDLSQQALEHHYPRPKMTKNLTFYKKAYADISRFMKKNGFEHRQFSVYISKDRINNTDINILISDIAKEMPWLVHCVNQIDVTNIGVQHSLLKTLEKESLKRTATLQPTQNQTPKSNKTTEQIKTPIKDRIAAAQVEAQRRNKEHTTSSQHITQKDTPSR